jgi:hypothetical protein
MPKAKRNDTSQNMLSPYSYAHPDEEDPYRIPGKEDQLLDAAYALEEHNDWKPLVQALLSRRLLPVEVRGTYQKLVGWELEPLSPKNQDWREAVIAYWQAKKSKLLDARGQEISDEDIAERVLKNLRSDHPGRFKHIKAERLPKVSGGDGSREWVAIRDHLSDDQ